MLKIAHWSMGLCNRRTHLDPAKIHRVVRATMSFVKTSGQSLKNVSMSPQLLPITIQIRKNYVSKPIVNERGSYLECVCLRATETQDFNSAIHLHCKGNNISKKDAWDSPFPWSKACLWSRFYRGLHSAEYWKLPWILDGGLVHQYIQHHLAVKSTFRKE